MSDMDIIATGETKESKIVVSTTELEAACSRYEIIFAQTYVRCGRGWRTMVEVNPDRYAIKDDMTKQEKAAIKQKANVACWKIRNKERVAALIERYNENAAMAVEITKATQLHDLEIAKEKALELDQLSAFVAATAEQNRILGYHSPTKIADPDGNALPIVQQSTVIILQDNGRDKRDY